MALFYEQENFHHRIEPIVTPYVKVGKIGIGLPVGALLKSMVWGDNDNPTRFRPPQPPPKKK